MKRVRANVWEHVWKVRIEKDEEEETLTWNSQVFVTILGKNSSVF